MQIKIRYGLLIVSFFLILFLIFYLSRFINFEYDKVPDALIKLVNGLEQEKKIDCQQKVTYCFEDSQCAQRCSNLSVCSHGVCLNSNIFTTTAPINECDASKGVLTFFVGNPAFGVYEYLCKSVDPGIADDDIKKPNRMCTGGNIDIDYTKSFPLMNNCNCPNDFDMVIVPATSTVREYGVCIPKNKRHLIL